MKRAAIAWGFLLSGCATVQPILNKAELVVYPRLGTHAQSVILPNTLTSIATLSIIPCLQTSPGVYSAISALTGLPVALDDTNVLKLTMASPSIDPSRPFVFRNLKPNSTYRVFGKAYNTGNALISQDNSSYTDVVLTNDDAPTMATLPISLVSTPFAAASSITVNTDGRFDYLKNTLYLVSNNSQVAVTQATRRTPTIDFANLQSNTSYKFVTEAYKLGAVAASASLDINITNENAPATASIALTIPYAISTLAGNGTAAYSGDGGAATAASLNRVTDVAVDAYGNVYAAEYTSHRVRKISPNGLISTFAGNGTAGYSGDGGQASNACIANPHGLAVDTAGNLYIAGSSVIRKVTPAGVISTFAGNGTGGFSGDGEQATAAKLSGPVRLSFDNAGNLYIVDNGNRRIRKVATNGIISTIAGNGTGVYSGDGGPATSAGFVSPFGVAVDAAGNTYIADCWGYRIRKVDQSGKISTIAGLGTTGFSGDGGLAVNAGVVAAGITVGGDGDIYLADFNNNRIRKINSQGIITTIGGNGSDTYTGDGSPATNYGLHYPQNLAMDALGQIYIADDSNDRVRKMQ